MKVSIGPYLNHWGPYQIADAIFFWVEKYPDNDKLTERWDYRLHDWFGDWLSKDRHGKDSRLTHFCNWIYERRRRRVKIKLDYYDHWNAEHTLALITLPLLKKLKETKHGSGMVDYSDVPDHLIPTEDAGPSNHYTDNTIHERWEWVLDEIIWTFEQIVDDDAESQFFDHSAVDHSTGLNAQISAIRIDQEGLDAWRERKQNGLRLFGKYYSSLWD